MSGLATGSLSDFFLRPHKNTVRKAVLAAVLLWLPIASWAAEYDAVLDWNRKAKLSTPVSGVVAKVNVEPGDRVNQDDVLLQLDNSVMKANLDKAKADVEYYQRSFKEAEREMDRNQELYDRTVLSDHELETAHIAFNQAKAQLKSAEAVLAKSKFDMRHSEIRAPFKGIIIRRYVTEGETVVSKESPPLLLEMADADVMIAQFQVTGNRVAGFTNGKKATVTLGGRTYRGEVSAVEFEPSPKSGNKYSVKVRFNTKGRLLRAGRAAKVIVR
jgi:multidrug efflux system membrane fusion protein